MSREREDQEPTPTTSGSGSDWLDDSLAFLAADLGHGSEGFGWLSASSTAQVQHAASTMAAETPPYQSTLPQPGPGPGVTGCATSSAVASPRNLGGQTKKRKSSERTSPDRARASGSRKPSKKGSCAKSGAAGTDRDARWAEQLLNPCAAAIQAGNLARAQHLMYVLGELASFSGEPNHRLAAHGLRALALRLPAFAGQAAAASIKMPSFECPPTPAFARVEPRLFRAALIRFHEASPWFALPNALANAAIVAHVAARSGEPRRQIRVVDMGVSHGVQWPTLLDALVTTRGVPRGAAPTPPPSVHLAVVAGPTTTISPAPFSETPPGYDSSPQLLRYARTVGLDLAIDHAPCLDTLLHGCTTTAPGSEVRFVCVQFRLSYLTADGQAAVLRKVRNMNPELVVLAELDGGRTSYDDSVSSAFTARLNLLWSFLESTAAAFKGRDTDERRVMEAEAGTALDTAWHGGGPGVHGRDAWWPRMAAAGFVEVAFGGEAVETARALLRKYDGGWELVPPSPVTGAAVGFRWKGQPVSFCSLWRPA